MSGGSFDYLCHAVDLEDLLVKRGQLERMAKELAVLGYAEDAARETEELVAMLRHWQTQAGVRLRLESSRMVALFRLGRGPSS